MRATSTPSYVLRATLFGLSFLFFTAIACHDAPPPAENADDVDRAKLEAIVAADTAFDRAMKAADDADRGGDDQRAAQLLQGDATKAADTALSTAASADLRSEWAKARRDSLVAVLHARKDALVPYAKALASDDVSAKLAALTTQLELQKWAVDAAQAALAPPGAAPAPSAPLR